MLARLRESLAAGESDYLAATVRETLRSRPVLIDVGRKLAAPATGRRLRVTRGAFMVPAIAAIHHREDLYPQPFEFRPERFLDDAAENYAWIPFGGGIRRCIGAAFAEYEMRASCARSSPGPSCGAAEPAPSEARSTTSRWRPSTGAVVVLERPLAQAEAVAPASSALA